MFGPLQHVYVTMHGEWTYPAWVGEFAQMGVRIALVDKDAIPPKGSIFTIPTHGDVTQDSGSQSGTHGTLSKAWTARIGPVGSIENMNAPQQIDLAEDCWAFLNALKVQTVQGFRYTHVKIAGIQADGAYGAGAAIYSFTTPIVGTATVDYPPMPPEVSVSLSLRAPIIGRRGRGRLYMPGILSASAHTDGTLQAATAAAARDMLAAFVPTVENLNGVSDYQGILMVTSAGKLDAIRPSEVRVGNHFDVQRRRQQQVAEIYSTVSL